MLKTFKYLTALLQICFQILLLVAIKTAVHPFTRADTTLVKPKYIQRQSHLIIGNHRGALDPFIICGGLPVRTIFKILPIGFMTHNAFYDSPLRPILWLSGCFPAKNPKGRHPISGVEGSLRLLKRGCSICIFPEGTRNHDSERMAAKSGVVRIHQGSLETPLILAHIEYQPGIQAWLTGQRRIVRYKLVAKPIFDDAESIMDEIFKL